MGGIPYFAEAMRSDHRHIRSCNISSDPGNCTVRTCGSGRTCMGPFNETQISPSWASERSKTPRCLVVEWGGPARRTQDNLQCGGLDAVGRHSTSCKTR